MSYENTLVLTLLKICFKYFLFPLILNYFHVFRVNFSFEISETDKQNKAVEEFQNSVWFKGIFLRLLLLRRTSFLTTIYGLFFNHHFLHIKITNHTTSRGGFTRSVPLHPPVV